MSQSSCGINYALGVHEDITHWGRVTHICVSNLIIIGSDNCLSPDRRQAIIWTNDGILLIGPLGTNFSGISFEIYNFHSRKCFENVVWKMAAILSQPQCVLKAIWLIPIALRQGAMLQLPCKYGGFTRFVEHIGTGENWDWETLGLGL